MGQLLQRVEGGIETDLSLGQLPLDGIGKAEEERIARGKHNDLLGFPGGVLRKYAVERHLDVDPLIRSGKQGTHQLMMALTT